MSNILITNARLVNEGETRDVDVLIEGERIRKIGSGLAAGANTKILDAAENC